MPEMNEGSETVEVSKEIPGGVHWVERQMWTDDYTEDFQSTSFAKNYNFREKVFMLF